MDKVFFFFLLALLEFKDARPGVQGRDIVCHLVGVEWSNVFLEIKWTGSVKPKGDV